MPISSFVFNDEYVTSKVYCRFGSVKIFRTRLAHKVSDLSPDPDPKHCFSDISDQLEPILALRELGGGGGGGAGFVKPLSCSVLVGWKFSLRTDELSSHVVCSTKQISVLFLQ